MRVIGDAPRGMTVACRGRPGLGTGTQIASWTRSRTPAGSRKGRSPPRSGSPAHRQRRLPTSPHANPDVGGGVVPERLNLTAAQLAIAREHGFASWRDLAAEVARRRGEESRPGGAAHPDEAPLRPRRGSTNVSWSAGPPITLGAGVLHPHGVVFQSERAVGDPPSRPRRRRGASRRGGAHAGTLALAVAARPPRKGDRGSGAAPRGAHRRRQSWCAVCLDDRLRRRLLVSQSHAQRLRFLVRARTEQIVVDVALAGASAT